MRNIKGKYADVRIHTIRGEVDQATADQLQAMADAKWAEGAKIEIMPDCHAGAGAVIGTAAKLNGKADPMTVGVDIGCAVSAVRIKEKDFDPEKLEDVIEAHVPSGMNIGDTVHDFPLIDDLIAPVEKERELKALGSLGGGNHFIEIDRDSAGNLWLIVHCGSRHLGLMIAKWHAAQGVRNANRNARKMVIETLKAQGREKEIENVLKGFCEKDCLEGKDYLEGRAFDDYIHDMRIAQLYSQMNHHIIEETIMKAMNWHQVDRIMTMHNYIDTDSMILRKGAVSAQKGERFVCPMNMRDGTLLCAGKGNPDWNCSAPHGAGRLLSRKQARNEVRLEDFAETMTGIWSKSVCAETLDESPYAYKPAREIIEAISETADVIDIMKPVFNFKAH